MEHFNSRFTSSHPILDDNPFDLVEKVITEEENVGLCLIPDEKEYIFFFLASTKLVLDKAPCWMA
jgi:hypothetical protein